MSLGCSQKFQKTKWGTHVLKLPSKIAKKWWGTHVLRVLSKIAKLPPEQIIVETINPVM
jgi:hypothetical protein